MKHIWTDQDRETLRRMYSDHSAAECAAVIGASLSSVYNQAHQLGLKKSKEFAAITTRKHWAEGRHANSLSGLTLGRAWNKGIKGSTGNHPNSRRTQFKSGRPASEASNYRPIGSTRICRDGYLERKVSDDPNTYPARRWQGVHRIVWEAANGQIPRGHVVVFKEGQHTTVEAEITIDRIELVTRAELMRRNSYHNRYPKEVAHLVQLRGAVTRQINKRIKA